ncbi:MAG: 23S rRNA (cytosine1962-C5)-methyltransferase, partial [Polyangiales bacterium]
MKLFPAFRDDWVLHHGGGLLVLDKPVHVPAQAPDGEDDDLPSRAKAHLGLSYLGVHQRLDAATSGVLAYTTDPERNKDFADDLERAEKHYIACVDSFKGQGGRLEHWLAPRPGGGSVVSSKNDSRAKLAVTHVEVLRRQGERTLLRLRIETGRTHQIRVQLAERGSPIAGDVLYGTNANTPGRLLLHAESLTVAGKTFVSAVPPSFDAFLRGESADLVALVRIAAQRRFVLARSPDTTAFRLFHGEAEGAPGVSIDVYGKHLLLHLRSEEAHAQEPKIAEALRAFSGEFSGLYVKRRPKQANEKSGDKRELAPPDPLWGEATDGFEVRENGLGYDIELSRGLSTGIFLDQRRARNRVREQSSGARVLNLFAYTCPFGVAAAAGGAREVINVDSSATALGRGKKNFERNHLSG